MRKRRTEDESSESWKSSKVDSSRPAALNVSNSERVRGHGISPGGSDSSRARATTRSVPPGATEAAIFSIASLRMAAGKACKVFASKMKWKSRVHATGGWKRAAATKVTRLCGKRTAAAIAVGEISNAVVEKPASCRY